MFNSSLAVPHYFIGADSVKEVAYSGKRSGGAQ